MNRTIVSAIVLFGALVLPFSMLLERSALRADAKPSSPPTLPSTVKQSPSDKFVGRVLIDFDTMQGQDWYESRYAVTRMLNDMRLMEPESDELKKALKEYREKEIIPYLVERIDFRETRRYEVRRFDRWKSMFPVAMTLLDMGPVVNTPILHAVAKQERSATYLYQARLVLTHLSGGKENFEKLIEKYAKEHPSGAARIRRLSHKHSLAPQMKREREYQELLLSLEPNGMLIPKKSEKTVKSLKALEKVLSTDKE